MKVTYFVGMWFIQILEPVVRARIFDEFENNMVSVIDVNGKQINLFTLTSNLHLRAYSLLTKEVDTISWIDNFKTDEVLWDIGANVGVYSLYAAVCRSTNVLAFEPASANFYVLSKNIQLNGLSDRITAYCLAFTDITQIGVMNNSSAAMGVAANQFGKPGEVSRYWDRKSSPVTHGMIGFSIDDFINWFNLPIPNHVKIDVDGLEPFILKGAEKMLRDPELRTIMLELSLTHCEETIEICKTLEDHGFCLVSKGEIQEGGSEQGANHFFKRRD